ncbi:MAG: MucR family transcriptional regulator [Rhodospirillales bacterium 20-64-7]|nr:MAG: MucR family transcriptional regulator [Rhodospirillales bacterium 20-64-7]HQT77974.1 MucR family transcriptional regulator [Rhodopila sp.]
MAEKPEDAKILGLTAQIVSAHVANNAVQPDTLPGFIRDIYKTLSNIGSPPLPPVEKAQPAVPIRKSVFPDYIICLEDGKRLKMLKRHLATAYNMTPAQYREKWGLDSNYPMVAPNYAEKRSSLAKQIGLGTRRAAE